MLTILQPQVTKPGFLYLPTAQESKRCACVSVEPNRRRLYVPLNLVRYMLVRELLVYLSTGTLPVVHRHKNDGLAKLNRTIDYDVTRSPAGRSFSKLPSYSED